MASALADLVSRALRSEFRRIDPTSARIILIDMGKRVLATFSEKLSAAAQRRLESLGVEVRLGHSVDRIDADGVLVGGERIAAKTVIGTAGVAPSPAGKWLKAATDRAGRVRVQPDLTVIGHPEILVVGDTATLEQDGRPLPGVAQVAMQQGRYAGRLIQRRIEGKPEPPPFSYFDKGSMTIVGKGFAVLESSRVRLSGFLAWMAWAAVHLEFLAQSSLRVSVFVQWVWTYLTGQRGSRLIVDHHAPVSHAACAASPADRPALGRDHQGCQPTGSRRPVSISTLGTAPRSRALPRRERVVTSGLATAPASAGVRHRHCVVLARPLTRRPVVAVTEESAGGGQS
jgi:NADH:quinone reductase (non-electrogenic)